MCVCVLFVSSVIGMHAHMPQAHTHMLSPEWLCVQSQALILLCDNLFYSLTAMPCLRTQRKENLYPNIPLVISPVSLSFPIFHAFPLPPHRLSSPQPSAALLIRCVHAKENKECGTFIFASLFCNFTIQ